MKRGLELSISTGSFYPKSTEHSIRRICNLGFTSIELTIQGSEIDYDFERRVDLGFFRKLGKIVRDRGIVVCSVHSPFLNAIDVFSSKARMEILRKSLEIVALFEANQLVLHPYHVFLSYEEAVSFFSPAARTVEDFLLPEFFPFLQKADDYGVNIAIENIAHWHDHHLTNEPRKLLKLVKALNHDSIRAVIDIFHSEFAGNTLNFLRRLANSVGSIHASDMSRSRRRTLPGRGKANWVAIFKAAEQLPKLEHVILEASDQFSDSEIRKSAIFLRRFLL